VDSIGSEKSALLVDEQWFQQWVAFGMLEIAVFLTNHAAFLSYCEHRDKTANRLALYRGGGGATNPPPPRRAAALPRRPGHHTPPDQRLIPPQAPLS
jgi:hypothetical protein